MTASCDPSITLFQHMLILTSINDPMELPENINEFQDKHNGFENTAFQKSIITTPCTILNYDRTVKQINSGRSNKIPTICLITKKQQEM